MSETQDGDDIFVGEFTLNEAKKRMFLINRQTIPNINIQDTDSVCDKSLKIIETHSTPNFFTKHDTSETDNLKVESSPNLVHVSNFDGNDSNDSFLKLEKLVTELCVSPKIEKDQFENTLDIVEYILSNDPNEDKKDNNKNINFSLDFCNKESILHSMEKENKDVEKLQSCMTPNNIPKPTIFKTPGTYPSHKTPRNLVNYGGTPKMTASYQKTKFQNNVSPRVCCNNDCPASSLLNNNPSEDTANNYENLNLSLEFSNAELKPLSHPKKKPIEDIEGLQSCMTPNHIKKTAIFKTPRTVTKIPSPKTPRSALSQNMTPLSQKKKFQNIVSPVACYINNCSVPTLVKNVHPRKPISSLSLIPICNARTKYVHNKESMNLPKLAYRTAKETKTIDVPDEHKLPQSQWCKQVVSSIPKAVVIKHSHRETQPINKHLNSRQEDSFCNLSLKQADLSVHIKKNAFKLLGQKPNAD